MSSVLFQSFNNNGLSDLRRDITQSRNALAEVRKDISFLIQALEEKAPAVAEEFARLKAQDSTAAANAAATRQVQQNQPNVINPNFNTALRR